MSISFSSQTRWLLSISNPHFQILPCASPLVSFCLFCASKLSQILLLFSPLCKEHFLMLYVLDVDSISISWHASASIGLVQLFQDTTYSQTRS